MSLICLQLVGEEMESDLLATYVTGDRFWSACNRCWKGQGLAHYVCNIWGIRTWSALQHVWEGMSLICLQMMQEEMESVQLATCLGWDKSDLLTIDVRGDGVWSACNRTGVERDEDLIWLQLMREEMSLICLQLMLEEIECDLLATGVEKVEDLIWLLLM